MALKMGNQSKGQKENPVRVDMVAKMVKTGPSLSQAECKGSCHKGRERKGLERCGGPCWCQDQYFRGINLIPISQRMKLKGREVKSPGWSVKSHRQTGLKASC